MVYLFNGISIPYGLFDAEIWFIHKCLIVIITIFLMFHSAFLFVYNLLFTQLHNIKHSYIMKIICTQLYGIKYSFLIQIIFKQIYLNHRWDYHFRSVWAWGNGNEGMTSYFSRSGASLPDAVQYCTQDTLG